MTPKDKVTEVEISKYDCIRLKYNLHYRKRNSQKSKETTYGMEYNMSKPYI